MIVVTFTGGGWTSSSFLLSAATAFQPTRSGGGAVQHQRQQPETRQQQERNQQEQRIAAAWKTTRQRLNMVSSSSSTPTTVSSSSSSPQDDELSKVDPQVAQLIEKEAHRQKFGLELIASENFTSRNVKQALGSCLTNKYSEGNIGRRYYGGNEYIDQIEQLCIDRALALFGLDEKEWGVNVQPYSGSPANFAVYTALLKPHDRIMGLDLPSGGHLTHGYTTSKNVRVSATSIYFESMPYVVSSETGLIDYEDMEYRAKMFQPKLIIAGGSAYPREWDYARIRKIADSVNAIMLVDMAHISGLVAANVVDNPFIYADVVTSTTHKTLRGPRSGMIFAKNQYMDDINAAVFPKLQGGPHNHQIAGLAIALLEARTPEFTQYAKQVIMNAQALAKKLQSYGHVLATNGTDNHLILWNVKQLGLTGSKVEKVLDELSITTNKNSIPGDISALNPGGVRLGTPALTTRRMDEWDMERVAHFLHEGCQIALQVQEAVLAEKKRNDGDNEDSSNSNKVLLKEFLAFLQDDKDIRQQVQQLKEEVETFAGKFYMP